MSRTIFVTYTADITVFMIIVCATHLWTIPKCRCVGR